MSWETINVNELIEENRSKDSKFKQAWDSSRSEYNTIASLISLRKQQGLSQLQLAELTGNKQQVISRIENKENSPTLKTLCNILDALGYDIKFVPRK